MNCWIWVRKNCFGCETDLGMKSYSYVVWKQRQRYEIKDEIKVVGCEKNQWYQIFVAGNRSPWCQKLNNGMKKQLRFEIIVCLWKKFKRFESFYDSGVSLSRVLFPRVRKHVLGYEKSIFTKDDSFSYPGS